MTKRPLLLTLVVAALAGMAGCGASSHTGEQETAATNSAAAPASGLSGKIAFRRFLDDEHSRGALFVMNAKERASGRSPDRLLTRWIR